MLETGAALDLYILSYSSVIRHHFFDALYLRMMTNCAHCSGAMRRYEKIRLYENDNTAIHVSSD